MLEFLTQSNWADRIGWMLVHSLWQFALVGLAAIGLRRALQRCSAPTRYGALLAAMSLMVLAPVATWLSPWSADAPAAAKLGPVENPENSPPLTDGDGSTATSSLSKASRVNPATDPQALPPHLEHAATGLASSWSLVKSRIQPWLAEIVLVWFAGVLVLAFRPLLSWYTVRRLRRVGVSPVGSMVHGVLERTAEKLELARAVQVLQSTLVRAPVVLGYFRPMVLLPACLLTGLPAAQLESILAHELAHVRRHDYLVNLLQTLVETLFFYHPAVWWLSRQIRNERENCCDDVAMAVVGSRADYGRALLAIEELRATSPALSLAASDGSLLARIRRIAGCEPVPRAAGAGGILCVILIAVAVITAAAWRAAPAAEKPDANDPSGKTSAEKAGGEKVPAEKSPGTSAPTAKEAKEQKLAERTLPVHVVDVRGKPIAGVRIYSNATAAAVATQRGEIINREYVSDADGLAFVALPKTLDLLRIWARKEGLVPMFAHWEQQWFAAGRPTPDEVTIVFKKGTTIGGFVKNEEGKPIAGAKVGVEGPPNLLKDDVDAEHMEVDMWLAAGNDARVTDAQGRWTLDNVPEGDNLRVRLSVTHPDYISDLSWGGLQELQGVTLASLRAQKGTIVMPHGISLMGSVTDPQGKGIAGAVVVWGDDPYDQTGSHQEHRQQVRTDANGIYRLPPMPPTTMTVTVIAAGWMPDLKKVTITPENPKVDFQLKKGRILRVRFVDSSGKLIPGVWVGIQQWRGSKSLYNTKHSIVLETQIPNQAGKNGVYEWTWAPDDEVQYQFSKEGYEAITSESIIADGAEHTITLAR